MATFGGESPRLVTHPPKCPLTLPYKSYAGLQKTKTKTKQRVIPFPFPKDPLLCGYNRVQSLWSSQSSFWVRAQDRASLPLLVRRHLGQKL